MSNTLLIPISNLAIYRTAMDQPMILSFCADENANIPIAIGGYADGWWVAAAFVVMFFERLVAARRIKILTDRLQMPLSALRIFNIKGVSTFYSLFLPGDLTGGAARWYRMSQPTGQPIF